MKPKIDICVGCDIVKVTRIKKMMQDQSTIQKVFHPSELTRFDAEHLAGIFAVKEAAFKALGLGSKHWLSLEVTYTKGGKPSLTVENSMLATDLLSLDCSISHDGGIAFAVVTALIARP
jgi:phosphopantetheine--protein transferase-like protein